jgi:asparagine synthase (glutamine-hydrolysing)
MCGIAGIFRSGDRTTLQAMTETLAHRGPDDAEVKWFDANGSGLGHRRLSIIDLSPLAHQPMSMEDGRLWIVHNGELYNYKAIRKELRRLGHHFKSQSDTEVILKSYVAWGADCLRKFNGMFAFAIYDTERDVLFAARDQIGIKPFYYASINGALAFASEIKAILKSGIVNAEPDLNALHTPTRFQISPLTGFTHIYKLPPAHFLHYERGNLSIHRYWDIAPTELNDAADDDVARRLDSLLNDAVRDQMVADVPVGLFLSGGLDSSVIAALMRKNTAGDIHAFTIKFSDDDQRYEKATDDSYYARLVADKLNLKYHEFEITPDICDLLPKIVWHMDEPLSDPAAINTYLIAKAARENNIIVLLNGMGGDEIFGGYRKHLACLKADAYQDMVPRVLRADVEKMVDALPVASGAHGLRALRWSKRFFSYASLPQAERFLSSDLSLSPQVYRQYFRNGLQYEETHFYRSQVGRLNDATLSYLTRMCLNDTKVFLPEHNLTYSDKAAMAASVEGRPPLTDIRIVEFMFSLPSRYRIRGNVQKYLLKETAKAYLPSEVIYRPKAPFGAPLRSWIRGPLAPMVNDLLSDSSLQARRLYNPTFVKNLIANDRSGKEDNAHVIWTLLTNEVWFRTFFGN